MFKQENRLTKQKDFDNVFKKGMSSFDNSLGLKAVKNNLSKNRIGVIVSSKISKKAVERNKIKRRLREASKLYLDKVGPGFDLVLIGLPESKEKSFQDLEKSIFDHLNKLKLLK